MILPSHMTHHGHLSVETKYGVICTKHATSTTAVAIATIINDDKYMQTMEANG